MQEDVCTFFGHADAAECLEKPIELVAKKLIEKNGVTQFYVGVNGRFDAMVARVLSRLQTEYPTIRCYCVLAYIPVTQEACVKHLLETVVPEGIECVPKRVAIAWRNRWMLRRSKYVVTHVLRGGGAATSKAQAEKQKKIVINIINESPQPHSD